MSLFNPYVILGLLMALAGTFWGGYSKGVNSEHERQQIEIARLNQEARQKEQALASAVNAQATQLVKANQNAKIEIQKRDAAIAAGNLKLRVPVKAECAVPVSDPAAVASGDHSGSAELQPEVARNILAIGDDADNTARKLNACIQAYNAVFQTLKGKP